MVIVMSWSVGWFCLEGFGWGLVSFAGRLVSMCSFMMLRWKWLMGGVLYAGNMGSWYR